MRSTLSQQGPSRARQSRLGKYTDADVQIGEHDVGEPTASVPPEMALLRMLPQIETGKHLVTKCSQRMARHISTQLWEQRSTDLKPRGCHVGLNGL
jgi:hypothetical protein